MAARPGGPFVHAGTNKPDLNKAVGKPESQFVISFAKISLSKLSNVPGKFGKNSPVIDVRLVSPFDSGLAAC